MARNSDYAWAATYKDKKTIYQFDAEGNEISISSLPDQEQITHISLIPYAPDGKKIDPLQPIVLHVHAGELPTLYWQVIYNASIGEEWRRRVLGIEKDGKGCYIIIEPDGIIRFTTSLHI